MDSFSFGELLEIVGQSKEAIFWGILGAVLGFVVALGILIGAGIFAFRRNWPSENEWSKLIRVVLLLVGFAVLTSALPSAGAIWGAGYGLKKTIVEERWVEKSTNEILSPMVAALCPAQDGQKADEHTEVDLVALRENVLKVTDQALQEYIGSLKAEDAEPSENRFSGLGKALIIRVLGWFANAQKEDLIQKTDEVFADVTENGDGKITVKEISTSIARIHLQPYVCRQLDQFVSISAKLTLLPAALILGIPILLLEFLRRRKKI